nr:cupin domain-containing protein [Sinorhizobium meliloti]
MSHMLNFDPSSVEAEIGAPAPDRLISGNPEFRTWNFEEAGGLYAGIWEATPGKWRIVYDEWEYFHILSGHSIVTEEGGGTPSSQSRRQPGAETRLQGNLGSR